MNDYISVALNNFKNYKSIADKALEQVTEEQFHYLIDDESNSIAIIMQHMIGNARSRFIDFFTSDGEKPDRHRDQEFLEQKLTKDQLLNQWNNAWQIVFDLLESMNGDDLQKIVSIRNEKQSALKAINRQIAHYSYHVGQIVFIAKHLKGNNWQTMSIAKGKSDEYNKGLKS
ncbi:MAG: DUF1572 family protein [bacterium]